MIRLDVRGLSLERQGIRVLTDIGISVMPGQMVGLLGPNGAGKSTLIRAMAGLQPCHGVFLEGRDIRSWSARDRARRIAYLPQGADMHWPMTVAQVVALGRLPHGGRDDSAAIARAMDQADVAALAHRPVTSLSGGERARVLLARALAVDAPLLLADEPAAHLDPRHQLRLLSLLADLARDGRMVMTALHDLSLAQRFCHRVVVLSQGKIAADGPPAQVLTDDLLARVYEIRVIRGSRDGQAFLLPWQGCPRS